MSHDDSRFMKLSKLFIFSCECLLLFFLDLLMFLQAIHKYYDFIVVGSGSAGAVVANRLSEQPNWNVLLLEAGGDEPTISDVPVLAAYLQLSDIDWQYKTEPQPTACLGFNEKK